MSDRADNTTNAASGETPKRPTPADMANNVAEERLEIGRRARHLASICLGGGSIDHDALFGLGPKGRAYFFALLKRGIAEQLGSATEAPVKGQPPHPPVAEGPVLDIAKGWTAQQVERRSYSARAFRLGAIWAAALSVLTVLSLAFAADHLTASAIQQFLERI